MITINLPEDDERRVNELLDSGQFDSAEKLLMAGIHAIERFDAIQHARSKLIADVEEGIADVRAGNVAPLNMDAIRAEARRQFEQEQRGLG